MERVSDLCVLTVLILCPSLLASGQVPRCNSNDKLTDLLDQTFDTVENKTVWSVCSYPNPQDNYEMCGRDSQSWLCDPEGLLTKKQADDLEKVLAETYNKTFCRCADRCSGHDRGHPVVVLLLDELRVPDLGGQTCTGGPCGQLYPQINPTGRTPSDTEQERALDSFSTEILRRWQLGRCSDAVVIVYWAKQQRISVAAGELALDLLEDIYESSVTNALYKMEEGGISVALSSLVEDYTAALEKQKRWPFYLGVTLAVMAGVVMIFGVIMTIVFCRKELQQGKTCSQVFHSCVGGEHAVLLGGNRPRMVPQVYEQTKTSDPIT